MRFAIGVICGGMATLAIPTFAPDFRAEWARPNSPRWLLAGIVIAFTVVVSAWLWRLLWVTWQADVVTIDERAGTVALSFGVGGHVEVFDLERIERLRIIEWTVGGKGGPFKLRSIGFDYNGKTKSLVNIMSLGRALELLNGPLRRLTD